MVAVVVGVVLFSLGLRLTLFPHSASGFLLLSLWLRDVAVACLLALALYLLNLVLIFLFAPADLSERAKVRWREVIKSRLESRKPPCSLKDMIDHAALLKIAVQRYAFRIRGFRNGP